MIELQEILENRHKQEILLAFEHPVSEEMLAYFFYTIPPVIRRDKEAIKKKIGPLKTISHENAKDSDLRWIKAKRDERDALLAESDYDINKCFELGLWRSPVDIKNIEWPDIPDEKKESKKAIEAYELCKIGFTPAEAFDFFGLTKHEGSIVRLYLRKDGKKIGHTLLNSDPAVKKFAESIYKNEDRTVTKQIRLIAAITGASQEDVKVLLGLNLEKRMPAKTFIPDAYKTEPKADRQQLIDKVYDAYTSGICEEDIALELLISRPTVNRYIREYRIQHNIDQVDSRIRYLSKLSESDKDNLKEQRKAKQKIACLESQIRQKDIEIHKTKKNTTSQKKKALLERKSKFMKLRAEKRSLLTEIEQNKQKIEELRNERENPPLL